LPVAGRGGRAADASAAGGGVVTDASGLIKAGRTGEALSGTGASTSGSVIRMVPSARAVSPAFAGSTEGDGENLGTTTAAAGAAEAVKEGSVPLNGVSPLLRRSSFGGSPFSVLESSAMIILPLWLP
jgi:hypothetical protein